MAGPLLLLRIAAASALELPSAWLPKTPWPPCFGPCSAAPMTGCAQMQHVSPGLVVAGKEKTVNHTAGHWSPLRYPAVAALACRAWAQHVRAADARARLT